MAGNQPKRAKKNEFLAGYLPYLLNRVGREMLRGVDKKFQEQGLSVSTWRILAVLSDRGRCGFGELANLTTIEPATLSRFVRSLIREGLIRRRRSTADGRAVSIALTEKGDLVYEATLPWALEVQNRLTRNIAPENVALLQQMLRQVYANIHGAFDDVDEADEPIAATSGVLDR